MYRNISGIKAVIFDCDGTLVNSEPVHYSAFKLALQEMGHEFPGAYAHYVGKPDPIVATLLAKELKLDASVVEISAALLEKKRSHYLKLCQIGTDPIFNTVNFLKMLADEKEKRGIKIAVCSAARKEEVLAHLQHLGVQHHLDLVLSGEDDLADYSDPEGVNKPKPYIYLHAMKILAILPTECVVFEDSISGVNAALSAGCLTIAIPNTYTHTHDFSCAHLRWETLAKMTPDDFFEKISNIM